MKFGTQLLATMSVAAAFTPGLHAEEPRHPKAAPRQTDTPPAPAHRRVKAIYPEKTAHAYPRTELFLGYSYLRATPTYASGNRLVDLNGGDASIAFNFTRSFGLVTDFGGFADSQLALAGPGANPVGTSDSKGSAYTFLFGPKFSYRRHDRFVPFAQVLAGGIYVSPVTLNGCSGTACIPLPAQTSFALTAGGGLDLKVQKHLALRLVQGEYLMTRLDDTTTGLSRSQNDIRLSAGLVFRFGGPGQIAQILNQPPTVSCSADPEQPNAGVAVHAQASDPDGDPLSYRWSSSAGHVDGDGADVHWMPGDAAPGTYTVMLLVDDGRGGEAGCNTNVHVAATPNRPPMLTCMADKTAITAGDQLHITATATDPDQDPVTLVWETSAGRVVGTGTSVGLDSTGLPSGHVTLRGHAFDGRGGVADCSVDIEVEGVLPPSVVIVEHRLALHSIYFPTAEPTEAHPDGGIVSSQQLTLVRLADDFQVYLQARPNAHLVLEGHADPRASDAYNMALTDRRVASVKTFLVGHGIPADSIKVHSLGDKENLTAAQVEDAVQRNPELTPSERAAMLKKIDVVLLASNRRVDITLENSGQPSSRTYPFNAKDSVTLLSKGKPTHTKAKAAVHPKQ